MKPFNLSVIEEFDAPSERPTWCIKINGIAKARVVKTSLTKAQVKRGVVLVKPFKLMTENHNGAAPWKPAPGSLSFRTTVDALAHFLRTELTADQHDTEITT